LGECGPASLEARARKPAQRGALEAVRLGLAGGDADREGVPRVDARQLGGGVADQDEVGGLKARRSERIPILG
jgi:hypothetical protein